MAEAAVAIPVPAASLIVRFASKRGIEPEKLMKTLKDTVFKLPNGGEVSNEQMLVLLSVAEKYDLDPMVREIYAFPSKGGGVVPIVGYDGWLSMMQKHPQYDGHETVDGPDEKGMPAWIECRVYRKDRAHPTAVREYMIECKRGTEPWSQWPRRMLRLKATIQAARAAFGFVGISDPDEAARIVEGGTTYMQPSGSAAVHQLNAEISGKSDVIDVPAPQESEPVAYAEVLDAINRSKSTDELDLAADLIRGIANEQHRAELEVEVRAKRKTLK